MLHHHKIYYSYILKEDVPLLLSSKDQTNHEENEELIQGVGEV